MAKVIAKLSKMNSVQSVANLERELSRWLTALKVLAIKRNDPEDQFPEVQIMYPV